jgi:hypothetical protein
MDSLCPLDAVLGFGEDYAAPVTTDEGALELQFETEKRTRQRRVASMGSEKPLRVTRLELRNWKNFTRLQVALPQRVFLVGPNASGKSNFLDAFRFLHDLVAIGGGFQEAVRKRHGVGRLRSLAARQYPDVVIDLSIGSDVEPAIWEYRLSFGQDRLRNPVVRSEVVVHHGQTLVQRPDRADEGDPARLAQTSLEQVNVNKDFRPVADFLGTVRYLHIVPQLVRDPDRSIGRRNDPYGGDFLELIAGTNQKTLNARLRRIRDALKIAVPQLQELELFRDTSRGTPHLRGKYEHWRPQGAWQTEEEFSDGTLRLMGLLWALLDGTGTLLLEEPELSLHPDVVTFVPQMLSRVQGKSGRQVILSTHSPDLLRDEGIGLDEVLLLQPANEGTQVRPASDFDEIVSLLDGGLPLGEAVMPLTRPRGANQLVLFGD